MKDLAEILSVNPTVCFWEYNVIVNLGHVTVSR